MTRPEDTTTYRAARGRGNQSDWRIPLNRSTGQLSEHAAHNAAVVEKKRQRAQRRAARNG